MPLTEAFVRSVVGAFPRMSKVAERVQRSRNIQVNYPLTLRAGGEQGYGIISEGKIGRGNDLLLLSSEECLFSAGLAGASAAEERQVGEQLQELSSKYESMNEDYLSRMRIYLQLIANTQPPRPGLQTPLRDYAEFVLGSEAPTVAKADINSRFLFELYQSWEVGNRVTFGYLRKELLKRTEEEEFLRACERGKAVVRAAGQESFKFAAPFVQWLQHSSAPNCHFDLLYFPHRKTPFLRIRALRDLLPGEPPTLSYGALNNYELLLRYGFTEEVNPYRLFMLPLNFERIVEIFNKNMEWKQAQFVRLGMRLRNYVKVLPGGVIDPQDMRMLRVLINDAHRPAPEDVEAPHLDPLILQFVRDHAQAMRSNIRINSLKQSAHPHVRRLEQEETDLLDALLARTP